MEILILVIVALVSWIVGVKMGAHYACERIAKEFDLK